MLENDLMVNDETTLLSMLQTKNLPLRSHLSDRKGQGVQGPTFFLNVLAGSKIIFLLQNVPSYRESHTHKLCNYHFNTLIPSNQGRN